MTDDSSTVRRPRAPHTATVHALLEHLHSAGFDGCPRPVASESGDVVTFVPGAADVPPPEWAWSEQALRSLGRLLRRMHDTTRGFRIPDNAYWQSLVGAPSEGDVICHNDLYWGNVVFNGGEASALIDWEYAAPGDALSEVGMAARYWVPLVSNDRRGQIGAPKQDPGPRLRAFCDAYGLTADERSRLLEATAHRLMVGYESQRTWAADGRSPFVEAWAKGSGDLLLRDKDWLAAHRSHLTPFLSA